IERKLKRSGKGNLSFVDQKNIEEQDPKRLLDLIIEAQEEVQRLDDKQTKVTSIIDDTKPIGIVYTGDWHNGGVYTAHRQMLEDFKTIKETEGLYTILMGDYNDNYTPNTHKGGNFEQIITADKQKDITELMFTEYFDEKTIGV